jgi:signal transduction histidine kinase
VRAQEHLLMLIRDILSYARIEAGHLRLDISDVPVNALLGGLRELVEPQFTARGLGYEFVPGPSDVRVRADEERCVQILVNLLTNAAKFTERGSVTLSWSADDERVRIRVSDTGPGIAPHRLAAIFEPFVQGGGGGAHAEAPREGVGLGLAISRELARAMGGDLTVESSEATGGGATFTLELPRATPRAAATLSQPLDQQQQEQPT